MVEDLQRWRSHSLLVLIQSQAGKVVQNSPALAGRSKNPLHRCNDVSSSSEVKLVVVQAGWGLDTATRYLIQGQEELSACA